MTTFAPSSTARRAVAAPRPEQAGDQENAVGYLHGSSLDVMAAASSCATLAARYRHATTSSISAG